MVKEVSCKQAGFEGCEFLVRDENEDEIVDLVQQHAERTHETSFPAMAGDRNRYDTVGNTDVRIGCRNTTPSGCSGSTR